jgi:hypothetical protein
VRWVGGGSDGVVRGCGLLSRSEGGLVAERLTEEKGSGRAIPGPRIEEAARYARISSRTSVGKGRLSVYGVGVEGFLTLRLENINVVVRYRMLLDSVWCGLDLDLDLFFVDLGVSREYLRIGGTMMYRC